VQRSVIDAPGVRARHALDSAHYSRVWLFWGGGVCGGGLAGFVFGGLVCGVGVVLPLPLKVALGGGPRMDGGGVGAVRHASAVVQARGAGERFGGARRAGYADVGVVEIQGGVCVLADEPFFRQKNTSLPVWLASMNPDSGCCAGGDQRDTPACGGVVGRGAGGARPCPGGLILTDVLVAHRNPHTHNNENTNTSHTPPTPAVRPKHISPTPQTPRPHNDPHHERRGAQSPNAGPTHHTTTNYQTPGQPTPLTHDRRRHIFFRRV